MFVVRNMFMRDIEHSQLSHQSAECMLCDGLKVCSGMLIPYTPY